ncbi:MAG: hypothetical protein HC780_27210, partial [Leptolyngbyaceae cyanobacterium CSU_1_3]|nr:hypothetical protein [Leptolyngbyaceae cyanobacterium CSU_1_3]
IAQPASLPPLPSPLPPAPLFCLDDLLEFSEGKISNVFGSDYAIVDTYSRRVRLPMPPYMFLSRVTKMTAKRGCYEPCTIETEFDIPENAWYALDGQIPGAVLMEACHANMLLISYLGVDSRIRAIASIERWMGT